MPFIGNPQLGQQYDPSQFQWNTGNDPINTLLNTLFPLDPSSAALGLLPGGGGAMGMVAEARTPAQGTIRSIMQSFPNLWKRAEADPRLLSYFGVPDLVASAGQRVMGLLRNTPAASSMSIDNRVLNSGGAPTVLHELLHFLTHGRVNETAPEHALETAQQLGAMMPQPFRHQMQNYSNAAATAGEGATDAARRALSEAFSYFGENAYTRPQDELAQSIARALGLSP